MINRNFICIIGGAGHVGAPLGLALSSKGYNVTLIDKNQKNIKKINNGIMPFVEDGCEKLLKKMIYKRKIKLIRRRETINDLIKGQNLVTWFQ